MTSSDRRRYGAGGPREKQREATRAALLDAAERLFSGRDASEVSVTDIGRAAGVSASLINAHFGGKAGLLHALVQRLNAPQAAAADRIVAADRPAPDKLAALLAAYADADLAQPGLLAALQAYSWVWPQATEAENAVERAAHETHIATVVAQGLAEGSFRPLDPAAAARAIFAIYTWNLRAGVFEGRSPADCAAAAMDETLNLIAAR